MGLLQFVLLVQSCFLLIVNVECDSNSDIEDVIGIVPDEVLQILYNDDTDVDPGDELLQSAVVNPPTVMWKADSNKYYTVLAFDPDAATSFLHWKVENIRGNQFESGDLVSSYISPSPPGAAHRYIFIACEQQNRKDSSIVEIRVNFNVNNFLKNDNCKLVATNYFRARNDGTQVKAILNKEI